MISSPYQTNNSSAVKKKKKTPSTLPPRFRPCYFFSTDEFFGRFFSLSMSSRYWLSKSEGKNEVSPRPSALSEAKPSV